MAERRKIALLNDSFPPTIDGVANVVVNYAGILQKQFADTIVATPLYPDVTDDYCFPVIRYPSIDMTEKLGYRAGVPYSPELIHRLEVFHPDIIHTHCPMMSGILARMLRERTGAPVVFTYHTKFDIDIKNALRSRLLQEASIKAILDNISACNDVWVVSRGAGENLKSLGYAGTYTVMENGVDFARRRAPEKAVSALRQQYGITDSAPVFLFVGRMMWYKGIRLSLDGLTRAKTRGARFHFVLVGDGQDKEDIMEYAARCGLEKECIFTGAIRDREELRTFFSMADLFLFPSTFDTNGIVVREAAACSCPSLLIRDSCAAEGITDHRNGLLIREDAEEMCRSILWTCQNQTALRPIGEAAASEIYLSWEDAVARANARYEELLQCRRNWKRPGKFEPEDGLLAAVAATLSALGHFKESVDQSIEDILARLPEFEGGDDSDSPSSGQ